MTNKDLIKQYVDTGIKISEYQFNQLNNNLKTTYLRKRVIASKLSPLVDYELLLLPDDDRTKYINNLDSNGIHYLLKDSKEPDKIINILLSTEGFINKLDSKKINSLLKNSKELDKIKEVIRKYRADIELNESKLKLSNLI